MSENQQQPETHIVINDKSKDSETTCLRRDTPWWDRWWQLYCGVFTEIIFKIVQHLANLGTKTFDCLRRPVRPSTVLLHGEEIPESDLTYGELELFYRHHITITGLTDLVSLASNCCVIDHFWLTDHSVCNWCCRSCAHRAGLVLRRLPS